MEIEKVLAEDDILVMSRENYAAAIERRRLLEMKKLVENSMYLHSFRNCGDHVLLGCKVCCSCDELIRTNVKNLLHIRAHEEAHTEGGVVCVHGLDDSITERIVDVGPKWGKDRRGGFGLREYKKRRGFYIETKFVRNKMKAGISQTSMVCLQCGYEKDGSVLNSAPWKNMADFEKHRKACEVLSSSENITAEESDAVGIG